MERSARPREWVRAVEVERGAQSVGCTSTFWSVNCSSIDDLCLCQKLAFDGETVANQPEGARCSVHPVGSGGGGVYVDLSMVVTSNQRIPELDSERAISSSSHPQEGPRIAETMACGEQFCGGRASPGIQEWSELGRWKDAPGRELPAGHYGELTQPSSSSSSVYAHLPTSIPTSSLRKFLSLGASIRPLIFLFHRSIHHVTQIRFQGMPGTPISSSRKLQLTRGVLQQTTIFSPEGRLYQVEYALEAISHAGTALGILAKDGIVLAAEKKVTSKLLEQDTSAEKLYTLNEYAPQSV